MHDPADVAQYGGSAVAVGSAVIGYANSAMGWLNHNSAGILALCGIGGLIVSVLGHIVKRRHMRVMLENELRQKQRRSQP